MNRPSSTITAASLAGMAVTLAWELIAQFQLLGPDPIRETLVASSVVFVSALVGYFKREKVMSTGRVQ